MNNKNIKNILSTLIIGMSSLVISSNALATTNIIEDKKEIKTQSIKDNYIYSINGKKVYFKDFIVDKKYLERYPLEQREGVLAKFVPVDLIYKEVVLKSAIYNKLQLKESIEDYRDTEGNSLGKSEKIEKTILLWKEAMQNLVPVSDKLIEDYYYSHLHYYNIPDSVELYYLSNKDKEKLLNDLKIIKFASDPKITIIGKQRKENKSYYLGYIGKEEYKKYFGDLRDFNKLYTLKENTFYPIPIYSKVTKEYMIFYVTKQMKAKTIGLEKVKEQIKTQIKSEIFSAQLVKILGNIEKQLSIKLNQDLIKNLKEEWKK